MSLNTKGTDPYNTADPTIETVDYIQDTIDWTPQPRALQPVLIEYNDEYWREVWGMRIEKEQGV